MLTTASKILRVRNQAEKLRGNQSTVSAPYPGSVRETYRKLYPDYLLPEHLVPMWDLFERAKRERVYACVSLPPRAGKTESLIAGIVDRLLDNPEGRVGYASYNQRFANKKSHRMRTLSKDHGLPIDMSSRSKQDWRTGRGEGGLWATSVSGPITGEGFELLVLDDLLRSRADAESAAIRDTTFDWILSDALTRLEPNGSVILCGTRWHADDHIGRFIAEGWEEYRIEALDESDLSYWPERWPAERLREIRDEKGGPTGYDWLSLYQQNPRAPGERVFQDPRIIPRSEVPAHGIRIAIGVDFAYTVGKSSDYSALVVMAEHAGQTYVLHAERVREAEASFRARVKQAVTLWGAQYVVAYIAATEQPNIDLMVSEGIPAVGRRAVIDKKSRALPTAAGWNTGRIMVCEGVEPCFTSEVCSFTGSDLHDDMVDSLAAVYDSFNTSAGVDWQTIDLFQKAAPMALDLGLQ